MAESCDGIAACLYEYFAAYEEEYADKLAYIPLPVNTSSIQYSNIEIQDKINFFIGINKARSEFKGTDLLLEALTHLQRTYPGDVSILKAESVTYSRYLELINNAHVVLDQIYSYSPAVNGLLTMALGKVLVSGGEPEMYQLLNETDNHPIVNIYPTEEDIYSNLESLVLNKSTLSDRGIASRAFVEKHHDYIKTARQYLDFWNR